MLYKMERFKPEHLKNFVPRDEQVADWEFFKDNKEVAGLWTYQLPICTFFADDKPLMIFGCANAGAGTYIVMCLCAKGVDKHVFRMIRCVYDYVDKFVGTDVRRFEGYVAADDVKANRLARYFGFEMVGLRRQAGQSGEDQVIYERLWRK